MTYTDALSRISQIQQQMTALTSGSLLSSASVTGTATSSSTGTDASGFATALAGAGNTANADAVSDLAAVGADRNATSGLAAAGLDGLVGTSSSATTGTNLPPSASSMLTSDQRQFASTLVGDTGLNPSVVCAWLLAEESGGAAQTRQSSNNNDWLNIGYTDSGTTGAGDQIWSDPTAAANATAGWLKGQDTIPGYGTASGGIQSILSSVGEAPTAQISALQNSGWASSGYPDLSSLYAQVSG